jgi:broad specificity phosphatase PhoE
VAARHELTVRIDPALREMHLGPLEGVAHAEARERFPQLASRRYEDMLDVRFSPLGESVRDVAQRLDPCVDAAIADAVARADNPRRVALVVYAHNTVTRLLLARAAGLGPGGFVRFAQGYGAINRIDLDVADATVRWETATIIEANRDPGEDSTTN